jgi:FdhD protein
MPSANYSHADARRLSTPRCGAGDEARGLGAPGEEGRARFDSAKQSRFIQSRQWTARRQKPIESQLKANRKPISHAAKRDQAAGRVVGEVALRGRGAGTMIALMKEFTVKPDPEDPRLVRRVPGVDQDGKPVETSVVMERPLTLYLNGQEIVTMMTIGDHPNYLAVGYLLNQNMLRADDVVTGIDYDEDLETVVVRTKRRTNFEKKLRKKTLTSGCAQGTVFGDLMEKFDEIKLAEDAVIKTSWLYTLSRKINTAPSLYLAAGAIHGCVLCEADRPLVYMEDVGRHNAVDKIAGYMHMHGISAADKIFYTTGRLTSEMVIKTVQMRIPILVSRSGFTAWGVDLARRAGLTLIGRAKGKRFLALAGESRILYDASAADVAEEEKRSRRKASLEEDAA